MLLEFPRDRMVPILRVPRLAVVRVTASVHLDARATLAVEQAFEMETCELVAGLLANSGCERTQSSGISSLQHGECLEIGVERGLILAFDPHRLVGAQRFTLAAQQQVADRTTAEVRDL